MKIKVDNNWWMDLFDEIYLLTDARSVCDEKLTMKEVDYLEQTLFRNKSAAILDMCGGQGRHSLELAKRGYKKVTVLDYSKYLVDLGRKQAEKDKHNTKFILGDARNTGLPGESFDYIIIMASSFGYFSDEGENRKILNECYRLLNSNGTLLLDLPNKEYVLKNFKSRSNHKINDEISVSRERKLGKNIMFCREKVISNIKGCIRNNTYCIRLYSPKRITNLMRSSGFSSVNCQKDFINRGNKGDYGFLTNRMIVTGRKAVV